MHTHALEPRLCHRIQKTCVVNVHANSISLYNLQNLRFGKCMFSKASFSVFTFGRKVKLRRSYQKYPETCGQDLLSIYSFLYTLSFPISFYITNTWPSKKPHYYVAWSLIAQLVLIIPWMGFNQWVACCRWDCNMR